MFHRSTGTLAIDVNAANLIGHDAGDAGGFDPAVVELVMLDVADLPLGLHTVQPVLEDLFKSQHFYDAAGGVDDDNFGGIIKSPLDLIMGTMQLFNVQLPDAVSTAANTRARAAAERPPPASLPARVPPSPPPAPYAQTPPLHAPAMYPPVHFPAPYSQPGFTFQYPALQPAPSLYPFSSYYTFPPA